MKETADLTLVMGDSAWVQGTPLLAGQTMFHFEWTGFMVFDQAYSTADVHKRIQTGLRKSTNVDTVARYGVGLTGSRARQ